MSARPLVCRVPAGLVLALALGLGGCVVPAPYSASAGVASVPLTGRTVADMLVSFVMGADCSLMRVDSGKSYCMFEPLPVPPPVCTRSLGTVDCWKNPDAFGMPLTEVADGPRSLTPGQAKHRLRWGSGL